MLVWRGRGILAAVVFAVTFVLLVMILPKDQPTFTFAIPFFTAALFSSYFGNIWNKQEAKILTDEKGEKFRLKSVHDLFWIPLQYWGVIFSALGALVLLNSS